MVESVVTVVLEVGKGLAAPIGRQFMYLYNYKSNFDNLKNAVDKLKDTRDEVKRKVDAAEKNVEEIKQSVQKWQENVISILAETDELIQNKANNRCFKGLCPNLITRYKHSRDASKKVKDVAQLLEEGEKFNEVSHNTTHEDIRLTKNDYEAFESRKSTLDDVLKVLEAANVDMVGVYGMGGIGKTTLVKEVAKQVQARKLFDEVIFVEVTDTLDIGKIQAEIADKLGLKFNNETGRADKLYARLKKGEKILVILDNIWEQLDLLTVGIPSGADHGGCKLLLTARDLNVLLSMDSTNNFLMGVLKEEEAWGLFKKMAGDVIKIRELQLFPHDVCNACKGLPIAIVTVAKALKNKRYTPQWRDALRQLKRPSPANFTGDLKMVYSSIELSYNYLRDEELKKTLLLCSLMGHEASILDLLKYAMGLSIFQGIYSMEELRDKIEVFIHDLKECCLLLDGNTNERFSMHDFVREVAISIANRDDNVLSVRNEINWTWPHQDTEKITKIFIRDSTISKLVEGLEYPQLESFFMNRKIRESQVEIPDNFFAGMTKLKVLDLNRMQLLSLPSSLHLLVNLQTLCLDFSEFEEVGIIGELRELKILSLKGSYVKQLPREIGQLTQLKLLDITDCQQLKVIAPNVISRLRQLEELYMSECSVLWEVEEQNVERSNASLEELMQLSSLNTLEIDIEDEKILPKGLFFKTLKKYNISIGDVSFKFHRWSRDAHPSFASMEALRTLKVNLHSLISSEELQNFKNVELLCLSEVEGVENVLYALDREGFSELKHLHLHGNHNLLCIVDSTKCVTNDAFPAFPLLESLILFSLNKLEKICYGQPTTGSFWSLRIIVAQNCGELKNIFSFSDVTQNLPQLEIIKVEHCWNMKEIFAIEREDSVNNIDEVIDEIKFCQLRFLTLRDLPRLASFYSEVKTPSTLQGKQKESTINLQPNDINLEDKLEPLKSLFNEKLVFPNLEALQLSGVKAEKIWGNQLTTMSSCYQNLTRLIIRECDKLKYAFSSSIVQSFKQLQHLEICNCSLLKEIIAKGRGEESTALFVFPRVTFLMLQKLPELTTFYPGTHNSKWPMLEKLEVCDCDKVKIFASENSERGQLDVSVPQALFLVEKINPNLKQLKLSGIDNMMTQQDQFSDHLICRFKVLEIINDKTTNIPVGILQKCNNLKQLKLHRSSYKEMFSYGEDEKHIRKQDSKLDFVLQNLEVLQVGGCRRLSNLVPSSVSFQNLAVLEVKTCNGLVNLIKSSTAKSLMQLTEMKIHACNTMIEIVENEGDVAEDEIVFNKMKLLSLSNLQNLICFCFGNYTFKFPSLEELIVVNCPNMKTFSGGDLSTPMLREVKRFKTDTIQCWMGDLNTTIQQLHKTEVNSCLEKLTLSGKDIMPIWQGQFPEYEFDKVKSLEVVKDESANIPIEILQRFNNLEKLVLKASSYKKVFSYGEDKKHVGIKILEVLYSCNLITLMPSSTYFENLTTLKVCYCHGLRNLMTSSTAKSLVQLQKMTIEECEMMIEVVANEDGVEKDEIVFRKLQNLSLKHLENLTRFCSGNHAFKFPYLRNLTVNECRKMKTFSEGVLSTPSLYEVYLQHQFGFEECWEGDLNTTIQQLYKRVVFPNLEALKLRRYESEKISWDIQLSTSCQNLTSLILRNCTKLKYVFPSSMVRSFEQLQHLEIRYCPVLKEIVAKEAEAVATFVFPQVTFLRLEELPELTSFYPGKHTSEWPLLKFLDVRNCDKVKIFTLEYLNFEAQFDILEPQSLFLVEKINPNLDELKLSGIDSMMTWHGHFPENLFCKFKILAVRSDKSANIQLGVILRLKNLEKLILHSCSYKEFFSGGENEKDDKRMLTQIKYLELWELSNLRYMWKQDSKLDSVLYNLEVLEVRCCERLSIVVPSSTSFQNLMVLDVKSCNGLVNLITFSTAKNLVQLTEMKIEGCKMMIEIVENEGDVAEDEICFNKLKWLSIENLESVIYFCSGNYTLNFPSLEELIVKECPKMKTFSKGALSTPRLLKVWQGRWLTIEGYSEGELNTAIQNLHKEAVNSNLEELVLSGEDIWQDQFSIHEFDQVKILEVIKDESMNIPIKILERFNNLEELRIKVCSYEEIFSCEKKGKHNVGALSQLKVLKLQGLFNLKYMGKHDSHLESIIQNLQTVEVESCHNLITLVPSSLSFENLRTLKVWHCDGLINLVSSSVAKSLVQLEKMTIRQCEMMTEIVANEGDVVENEIIFSKLRALLLDSLESLKCFCSGNYTFKFPSLEMLDVRECPKMKTFCKGDLSTPTLWLLNGKKGSVRDLNARIQRLHIKNEL